MEKKKKLSLPAQIFIALVLGIVVGLIFYFAGAADFTTNYVKPFGDIFVNLLKFIVVPVVLLSMIDGIISMGNMKKVGSVGWKTVVYFMITTAIACVIGLVLASIFNGAGLFPNLSEAAQSAEYEAKEYAGFMATLVAIFPTNMWKAFTDANMLQVIVIALLFGGSILVAGEKAKLVRDVVDSAYAVIDRLMSFIISLSPIGVFTYMTWVVATQGAEILGSLALVILCAYIGYIIHAVVVYSLSAKAFAGISPVAFFKGASAAMIFAFTSTSSAATLPVSKECADSMGAEDDISSFVLPLGATINMDGTAIYQCVATVFLATCAGMQLTLGQMVLVVVTATLASIGTAGTPGAGMIMLSPATLPAPCASPSGRARRPESKAKHIIRRRKDRQPAAFSFCFSLFRSLSPAAQPDSFPCIAYDQHAPDHQYRSAGQKAVVKDHVSQKQRTPEIGAELAGGAVSLIAGLPDLAVLRLIAAFPPELLEFFIVDAALFLRIHFFDKIYRFLLKQDSQRQHCDKQHKQRHQTPQLAVRDSGRPNREAEKADDHRQILQHHRPAQLFVRLLHDRLILAVPAAEGVPGGTVKTEADPQKHGGADQHSPQGASVQHPGKGCAQIMLLPEISGYAGQAAQHAADQPGDCQKLKKFGKRLLILTLLFHCFHPLHS